MKYIGRVSVLLALFTFVLFSCKTTSSYTDYSAKSKLENALLWKIEGKDLKQPSYLYGTIHLIPKEDYFLPSGILGAFDAAEKVYFEIDMNEMNDMSKMMGMMSKIMMPDNKTLKDVLPLADYELVNNHFKSMGLPMMFLERMKPMFLTVFASGDMSINGGKTKSYEMELMNMAKESNKEIGGLETIDFQLSIFDKIPLEAQAEMLVEGIKSAKEGNDEFAKMVNAYKDQNIELLDQMMHQDDSNMGVGDYDDVLLVERNKNWIPIIAQRAKVETTFFAVGAGHLPGVNGVIKLLRKEGFKVSPVSHKKN